MDYLTAIEFSKKWDISSRMVARYCEAGRIDGAIKKGKTWLLPANSERPMDQRRKRPAVKTVIRATGGPVPLPIMSGWTFWNRWCLVRSSG